MTSTPFKLDTDLSIDGTVTNDGATLIETFDQLHSALQTDSRFAGHQVSAPKAGVIHFQCQDTVLVLIDISVWRDESSTTTANLNAQTQHILICCGGEADFKSLPTYLDAAHVQQLVLPSPLHSVAFQLRALLRDKESRAQAQQHLQQADESKQNIKHVLSISRELNKVRNVNKLLGLILAKAREVTRADAGSIYVIEAKTDKKDGEIIFKVSQNESVQLSSEEFRMPLTDQSIVGNSAINAKTINIPDLYKLSADPCKNIHNAIHDQTWDKKNGYETHSMLSLPIFDISHEVIGVIQLINCKIGGEPLTTAQDFAARVVPFDQQAIEYAEIVAHQAGIALENAILTQEKEELFRGFVNASVKAIEQRDPTTSGHSHRVAQFTLNIAEAVKRTDIGIYKNVSFTENQMKEIEYASLLHDFGKLGVREQVLLKSKKLHEWQLGLLTERFELIRAQYEIDYLKSVIDFLQSPKHTTNPSAREKINFERQLKLQRLDQFFEFILQANEPTVLEEGSFDRLKDIANLYFYDSRKAQRPFLTKDELKALSVSKGSLTSDEFAEIQSHVSHTFEFLKTIPWGKDLANVPEIAAKHHEKLDGTGYPFSAKAHDIPIQSRMMAIADIFDALTAADRPYKKSVPLERALDILHMEVKAGKCDGDLLKIFIDAECFKIPPRKP